MNDLPPPTSATPPRVYANLADDLAAAGIEAVFGLMSDDTALLITALEAVGIRFFGTRHENNAVVMAEGFAAATGTLGIAVIGRGPGAANCVNAMIHASRTGTPLLILTGDPPRAHKRALNAAGPDYKGFDIERMLSAAGLSTFRVTSARSANIVLADAMADARLGQTVVLHVPVDILAGPGITPSEQVPAAAATAPAGTGARKAALDLAARMIDDAKYPVILAGHGAWRTGAAGSLLELAEKSGALLFTSLRAKDMFRDSPYNLGIAGSFSHSTARRQVEKADCIVVAGAGLNMLTTSFGEFFPPAPLIQIDHDRKSIGRHSHADIALIGDAAIISRDLTAAVAKKSLDDRPYHAPAIIEEIAAFDHRQDYAEANTDWTVDMRSLALRLDEILPTERDVVFDIGNFFAIAPYITVPNPDCLRYTAEFGSIGLGFGTALGVAAARRDRPTYLFIGDGALLMTLGELETVAREELPLVILVLNDNAYGAERHFLGLRDQPIGKSVFPATDFGPVAESFGIESVVVRSIAQLDALSATLANTRGPLLVDCKINPAIPAPFLTEFARLEGY